MDRANEPKPQQKIPFTTRLLYNSEELVTYYFQILAISILNLVCLRSWAFNLVVLTFALVAVVFINLVGRNMVVNKWVKALLRSLWFFASVLFYINFWVTLF